MAGTREGGLKAAQRNKELYGESFYAKIGAKGGIKGTTGGFYASKATGKNWHVEAGRKGGKISKPSKRGVDSGL